MSSKAIKKLRELKSQDKSDPLTSEPAENDKDSPHEETEKAEFQNKNRFSNFNLDSNSDSEASDSDDDILELPILQIDNNNKNSTGASKVISPDTGAIKKRKKKKRKNGTKHYPASSEDQMNNDLDDIDKSIKEVNAMFQGSKSSGTKSSSDSKTFVHSLLCVERKFLNPQNEMKRIFGSRVVNEADKNNRRGGGHIRSSKAASRLSSRGNWIAQGEAGLALLPNPGLSMVLEESNQAFNLFRFCHSPNYQKMQFRFLDAVETVNPDNIMPLLQIEPLHVDTLLQVGDIFRAADDTSMGSKLDERAIYALESSAHPLFNLSTARSRLSYKQRENRCFFIALFRHILSVGVRGCYRTALELCKVLLSLAPDEDPLAVSLMIDFYALRGRQYEWLVKLYDTYEPTKNLSMLPSFAYSIPLALFHLSEIQRKKKINSKNKFEKSDLGSFDSLRKRANSLLQTGIITFPGVVAPLLRECGVQPDKNFEAHKYFSSNAYASMKKGLMYLVDIYIGRSFHVWKEEGVIGWLEENVRAAMSRVDGGDSLSSETEAMRNTRYLGTPMAIYRHVIMSNIKNVTVHLPPSLSKNDVLSFDPLPPHDSVCEYERPAKALPPRISPSDDYLAAFFRSIFPNYVADDAEGQEQQQQQQQPAGAVGGEPNDAEPNDGVVARVDQARDQLGESVQTLLQAMRNLLTNMDDVAEADDEEDDDNDEDEFEDPPR